MTLDLYEWSISRLQARRIIDARQAQASLDPEGLFRLYSTAYDEELAAKVKAQAILRESSE